MAVDRIGLRLADARRARETGVSVAEIVRRSIDTELRSLVVDDGEDAKPTTGFQRVVQRAVLHVQNSGRDEVTGADVRVLLVEDHAMVARGIEAALAVANPRPSTDSHFTVPTMKA